MWILVDARLHQRHRHRGVAPGKQLAAVHGEGGRAAQTLGPCARLLVMGECAAKRQHGRPGSSELTPAVVLARGERAWRVGSFGIRQRGIQRMP